MISSNKSFAVHNFQRRKRTTNSLFLSLDFELFFNFCEFLWETCLFTFYLNSYLFVNFQIHFLIVKKPETVVLRIETIFWWLCVSYYQQKIKISNSKYSVKNCQKTWRFLYDFTKLVQQETNFKKTFFRVARRIWYVDENLQPTKIQRQWV